MALKPQDVTVNVYVYYNNCLNKSNFKSSVHFRFKINSGDEYFKFAWF